MSRFTVEQLIEGVRKRDNIVLQYIYKSYYSTVFRLVVNNSGTEDDVKDIFQETLIVLFRNVREDPRFKLSCTFQTYLYSVARLLWLKHLPRALPRRSGILAYRCPSGAPAASGHIDLGDGSNCYWSCPPLDVDAAYEVMLWFIA